MVVSVGDGRSRVGMKLRNAADYPRYQKSWRPALNGPPTKAERGGLGRASPAASSTSPRICVSLEETRLCDAFSFTVFPGRRTVVDGQPGQNRDNSRALAGQVKVHQDLASIPPCRPRAHDSPISIKPALCSLSPTLASCHRSMAELVGSAQGRLRQAAHATSKRHWRLPAARCSSTGTSSFPVVYSTGRP